MCTYKNQVVRGADGFDVKVKDGLIFEHKLKYNFDTLLKCLNDNDMLKQEQHLCGSTVRIEKRLKVW